MDSETAIAMVNLSRGTSTVTITASDIDGNTLATSSPIVLPPMNKTEAYLRSFPGLGAINGHRGRVQFISTGGPVAVLGIRFHGVAFTDIPASPSYQLISLIGVP